MSDIFPTHKWWSMNTPDLRLHARVAAQETLFGKDNNRPEKGPECTELANALGFECYHLMRLAHANQGIDGELHRKLLLLGGPYGPVLYTAMKIKRNIE